MIVVGSGVHDACVFVAAQQSTMEIRRFQDLPCEFALPDDTVPAVPSALSSVLYALILAVQRTLADTNQRIVLDVGTLRNTQFIFAVFSWTLTANNFS